VNNANSHINPTFTYSLSPDSQSGILDVAPNGAACAGSWNAPLYSICSPGTSGVVQVIASALGASSAPTFVFVHPAIAKIQVSVVPPVNAPPPACPNQIALPAACAIKFNQRINCFSPNQAETLKATSFDSQGNDISVYVGPVTWTSTNFGVATLTPVVNPAYSVSTNQVTVTPGTPGQTEIVAQASGISSEITPASVPGSGSFFEACPVQCIALDLGTNGQFTNQTSFVATKGTAETVTAYAVDIQGCLLSKPPLTWTSSQPAAIAAGSSTVSCAAGSSCALSTSQQGAAAITASCTPPTCNIGFPLNLNPGAAAPYIPQPVYPVTAISGLVTGSTSATSVLATSQDCYSNPLCGVAMYSAATSIDLPGSPLSLPTPPNSLMFDGAGDKAYVGSEFGAQLITVSSIGSNTMNPFSPLPAPATTLGALTGRILAISPNGSVALFADNVSTPNQVYLVNTGTSTASTTPLNISSTIAAAFSPDGLKAFILGNGGDTLYIYSTLQALQPAITLPAPATSIVFNSTGSFALLAGGSAAGTLGIYNTCDNSAVTLNPQALVPPPTPLPGPPMFLRLVPGGNVTLGTALIPDLNPVGLDFFFGVDNTGIDIIATNSTQPPTTALCPQTVALASNATKNLPIHIDLHAGTFHPINFFVSPDATQVYIVTSDQGVLFYNFSTRTPQAIPLSGGAAPLAADITADGSLIYVAATDGKLHQLVTETATEQELPTSFFPLPNSTNSFCYSSISCALNLVAVKP
jgi:hypothetical protein